MTSRSMVGSKTWKLAVLAWLVLRTITSLAAAWSLRSLEQGVHVQVPGYVQPRLTGVAEALMGVWLRSDALWYLKIAEHGYGDLTTFAFYPVFPLAARLFSFVMAGNELLAGLIVSSVATIVGLACLFAWVRHAFGEDAAYPAMVGYALFPTAFFLVAPYGESVFFAAGSAALMFAANKRWMSSAISGFIAGLSRPFGALLCFAISGQVLSASNRTEAKSKAPIILAGIGPAVGAAVWFVFVGVRTGDLLAAGRVQGLWQRKLSFPLTTLISSIQETNRWWGTGHGLYFAIDLIALLLGIALVTAAVTLLKRRAAPPVLRWGVGLYGAAVLLVALISPFPPRPLLSMPRFLLALFPVFGACTYIRGRIARWGGVAAGAGLLFVLTALFVAGRPIF